MPHHGHSHGPHDHSYEEQEESAADCWVNLATIGESASIISGLLYGISWGKFIQSGIQLFRGEEYDGKTSIAAAMPSMIFYVTCAVGAVISHRKRHIHFAKDQQNSKHTPEETCSHSTSTPNQQTIDSATAAEMPTIQNESKQENSAVIIDIPPSSENDAPKSQTQDTPLLTQTPKENYNAAHVDPPKHQESKSCCSRIKARFSDTKKIYDELNKKQKAILFCDFTSHSAEVAGVTMTGIDAITELLGTQLSFGTRAAFQLTVSSLSILGTGATVRDCAQVLRKENEAARAHLANPADSNLRYRNRNRQVN